MRGKWRVKEEWHEVTNDIDCVPLFEDGDGEEELLKGDGWEEERGGGEIKD